MFTILSYDVEETRVKKVCKIAKKYLHHVQNSLFHGFLTEKQYRSLKHELSQSVKPTDKISFYRLENTSALEIDEYGFFEIPETDFL